MLRGRRKSFQCVAREKKAKGSTIQIEYRIGPEASLFQLDCMQATHIIDSTTAKSRWSREKLRPYTACHASNARYRPRVTGT